LLVAWASPFSPAWQDVLAVKTLLSKRHRLTLRQKRRQNWVVEKSRAVKESHRNREEAVVPEAKDLYSPKTKDGR
jgi:hypothetical protein